MYINTLDHKPLGVYVTKPGDSERKSRAGTMNETPEYGKLLFLVFCREI